MIGLTDKEIYDVPATQPAMSSSSTSSPSLWPEARSFASLLDPLSFGMGAFLPGDDFVSEAQEAWRLTPFEVAVQYVRNRYGHDLNVAEDITRTVLLLYLGQLKEKGWSLERSIHQNDYV